MRLDLTGGLRIGRGATRSVPRPNIEVVGVIDELGPTVTMRQQFADQIEQSDSGSLDAIEVFDSLDRASCFV